MIDDIILAFDGENFAKKEPKIGKKTSIKNVEWEHINKVLSEFGFNISKAARVLGMHRKTLARKLQKRVIK
jgi:two-component system response regulator RegA